MTASAPLEKLREGFRFVRHTKPIRALLVLVSVVSFMALPYTVLMPIFAVKILHGGASAYGTLMGAVGVGAMFGALVLAMRQQLRGLGNFVAYSAMGLGVSLGPVQRVPLVLDLVYDSDSFRIHDDDAVYRDKHAHTGDGAGPASRASDVHLLDDVSGDVAARLATGRVARGSHRRAGDRRDRRASELLRRTGLCEEVARHARPGARPRRRAGHDDAGTSAGGIRHRLREKHASECGADISPAISRSYKIGNIPGLGSPARVIRSDPVKTRQ